MPNLDTQTILPPAAVPNGYSATPRVVDPAWTEAERWAWLLTFAPPAETTIGDPAD